MLINNILSFITHTVIPNNETVHQKEVQRKDIRQYGLAQRQDKELLFLIELGSKSPYGEGKITFRPLLGKFHEDAT